jgi:UDP-2,3-diacylglucosamine hydrolase
MRKSIYFISDIHLGSGQGDQLWLQACDYLSKQAKTVYILGDLFNIWFGQPVPVSMHQSVQALRLLASTVKVFVMTGNRDFLLTASDVADWGCQWLPDPSVIDINHQAVLLTHGDALCMDPGYQRYRRIVQHSCVKKCFLALPSVFRQSIAQKVQQVSKQATINKYASQFQIDQQLVQGWLTRYQASVMVHGHIHQWQHHHDPARRRIVLSDWQASATGLCIQDHQWLRWDFGERGAQLSSLVT